MPIGYIFWAIFLIIILFNIVSWRSGPTWQYAWGGNVIILVLLFLLGWAEFGFILQGGGYHHPF